MTRCPMCKSELPEANEPAYCGPCSVALFQKILMEPCEDPTALQCKVCRSFYPLNSARVRRAIESQHGNKETPELCWVCAHLHLAAQREAAN